MKKITILLAAGGTGGHVFPAVAVAEELCLRGLRPIFITDRRGKAMIPKDLTAAAIFAASPYGATKIERLKGMIKLGIGGIQTVLMMVWHRPKFVIGFGGYPSVAPVLVAKALNIPSMLHEQNAYFGRANRFLSRFVRRIGLSWPMTKNIPAEMLDKAIVVGMPVRQAFYLISSTPYTAPHDHDDINILIVGGSLGAEVFGDTVPEAISRLPEDLRKRLKVTHQVRPHQLIDVAEKYDRSGIRSTLSQFITNMPFEMAASHLVICRGGASSVAELAAAGRPALLVPYPDAMDDHQTINAEAVVAAGGGWLIPEHEMSAGSLAGKIATLISTPEKLRRAADAVKSLNTSMAASVIADDIIGLVNGGRA